MRDCIYLVGTNIVPTANIVPLTQIVRRVGQSIMSNGTGVTLRTGYYSVVVDATFTSSATGDEIITLLQDGLPVTGANATITVSVADTQVNSASIHAIVRVYCNTTSQLAINSSLATVDFSTISMVVERL